MTCAQLQFEQLDVQRRRLAERDEGTMQKMPSVETRPYVPLNLPARGCS